MSYSYKQFTYDVESMVAAVADSVNVLLVEELVKRGFWNSLMRWSRASQGPVNFQMDEWFQDESKQQISSWVAKKAEMRMKWMRQAADYM